MFKSLNNISKMSDNVYVNVSINNNTSQTLASSKTNIQYEQPILGVGSDYYMAVTKFEIPLGALPLMVWPENSPENLFVVGVCGISASTTPSYNGFDAALVYNNPFGHPNDFNYNYIYSYQYLMDMINQALQTAWVAAGSPGGAGQFPYFSYNCNTRIIELILPLTFVNDVSLSPNGNTVYWNNRLQDKLISFNIQRTRRLCVTDPSSPRYEVILTSVAYDDSQLAPNPPFAPAAYKICQDFPTNDYMNSVRKIVITSNSLPINKEIYPPSGDNGAAFNNIPIVTDFQLDLNNVAGAQRSVALFEAQIYQLIDIVTTQPMYSIGLELYWADKENRLYPLPLLPYDNISIKLAFLKKSTFDRTRFEN